MIEKHTDRHKLLIKAFQKQFFLFKPSNMIIKTFFSEVKLKKSVLFYRVSPDDKLHREELKNETTIE